MLKIDPLAVSLSIKVNFYDNINFIVQPINSNLMELDVARTENDERAKCQGWKQNSLRQPVVWEAQRWIYVCVHVFYLL